MVQEASVVKTILKFLNNLPGCYATKIHGNRFTAGQPDIIGTLNGQTFAFEVKRPGNNRVTPLQEATLRKWSDAGAITGVVHGKEEVKRLLGV